MLGINEDSLIWVVLVNGVPFINGLGRWRMARHLADSVPSFDQWRCWWLVQNNAVLGHPDGNFPSLLVRAFCASVVSKLLSYCFIVFDLECQLSLAHPLSLDEFTRQLVQLGTWLTLLKFSN